MVCFLGVWLSLSCCEGKGVPLAHRFSAGSCERPAGPQRRRFFGNSVLGWPQAASTPLTLDNYPRESGIWCSVSTGRPPSTPLPASPVQRLPQEASHCSPPEPVAVQHRREEKSSLTGGCGDALLGLEVLQWPARAGASAWTPLTPGEPALGAFSPATSTHLIPSRAWGSKCLSCSPGSQFRDSCAVLQCDPTEANSLKPGDVWARGRVLWEAAWRRGGSPAPLPLGRSKSCGAGLS